MQKIIFIAFSLFFIVSLNMNAQSQYCKKKISMASVGIMQENATKQAVKQENTEIIKLKITGLTCAGCANQLHKVLKEMDGVVDNSVEYPGDIAVVHYNPDKTSPELIIEAIEKSTSYTAELVKNEVRKKS